MIKISRKGTGTKVKTDRVKNTKNKSKAHACDAKGLKVAQHTCNMVSWAVTLNLDRVRVGLQVQSCLKC